VWLWVTVLGLVVEVGVIVVLGRAATRGTEQDQPPAPADVPGPVTAHAAVRQAARRAAPAARR
jgi:hypothetical protein